VIRVLIVDDSAYNRVTIERLVEGAADMQVVGTAMDGYEAIRMVRQLHPDLLTLDLEMPNMDGLSFLRWLMSQQPLPVLVVTSRESNYSLFEALELGALDFVLKPGRVSPELPKIREALLAKIRDIVRSRPRLRRPTGSRTACQEPPPETAGGSRGGCRLFVLAASTGGPPALQTILRDLSPEFPGAVLIAQHMPAYFTATFARRLNELCALPVREAAAGDEVCCGQVLVAPGGQQMTVRGDAVAGRLWVDLHEAGPEDRHVPSGDLLMESVAHSCGFASAGIVLTGMGDDGSRGLAAIRRAGGRSMAESEATAVVYGMPRHATAAGVVEQVCALESMAVAMELVAREPLSSAGRLGAGAGPVSAMNETITWREHP
jgi:two-component system chemotaxis response regulator CheB